MLFRSARKAAAMVLEKLTEKLLSVAVVMLFV
jgi:hypothetical protein